MKNKIEKLRKMCNTIIINKQVVISLKRNAIQDLVNWKSSEDRKPMVLKGARQVGKTWMMKEFGRNEYYGSNVPLFRRNGYQQSGTMIP